MAENEAGAAVQETVYPVKIEEIDSATRKVTVEIPAERISQKLAEEFKTLRTKAQIPGFRPGHAPQKLIEKKFHADVREDVKRELVSEGYKQAIEKNELSVLGEPEFDNPDSIALPESGSLTFSFQVELQPKFELPDLKGIKVKKPKLQVTEEHINEAMRNLCEQQGNLIPVEDRGVEERDYLIADVSIKSGETELAAQKDAQIVARSARLAGVQIDDLPAKLAGLKIGEKRSFTAKVQDTYPNEAIRGKDVQFDLELKDLKKLEPAVIDQQFLEDLGFANEQELRDALKEQMAERITSDVNQTMREQVHKYLLENIQFELPSKLSAKQEFRVVNRRASDLLMRGVPREQIEANIEKLKAGAKDEAVRELKLFFILQKIAEQQKIDVDEPELNGRIAAIAANSDSRPEKLKQEMAKDGRLMNLYLSMREQKAVDQIIATAEIEEVDLPKPESK